MVKDEALVGKENVSGVPLTDLESNFERARLFNKLVNIASETEVGRKGMNSQHFKAIVGEDIITAAYKGVDSFEFRAFCKLVSSCNKLPKTNDSSEGYFRRLDLLPFTRHFSDEDKDPNLKEKVLAELPGIFNLAMKGLETLQKNDFKFSPCKASEDLLKEYKLELRPMVQFFDEMVVKDETGRRTNNKVAFESYKDWAKDNGYKRQTDISAKAFWRDFKAEASKREIVPVSKHSNRTKYHTGFRLL